MTTGGDSSVIAGRLTDAETGDPVTFAGVYLEGTALSTFSDMEGYFRLLIPEEADTFTTYTLLVRSVGYEIQRITLDKSDLGKNKQIHLKIKVAEVTLGMMVMDKKALRRQKRKAARDKKQE